MKFFTSKSMKIDFMKIHGNVNSCILCRAIVSIKCNNICVYFSDEMNSFSKPFKTNIKLTFDFCILFSRLSFILLILWILRLISKLISKWRTPGYPITSIRMLWYTIHLVHSLICMLISIFLIFSIILY